MKALLLVLLLVPVVARADERNIATLTTGAEHGMILGAGYDRLTTLVDRLILVGGDLTIDVARPDVHDVRLRIHAIVPLLEHGHWKLSAGVAAVVRTTHDDIAQMVDLGTDAALIAGRYTPRWFAAGEVGFDWAFATHITPSADYRMQVYPDARDGWYHNTGGLIRVGIQGGFAVGDNDLAIRIGMLRDDTGKAPILPMYGTLSYARRW